MSENSSGGSYIGAIIILGLIVLGFMWALDLGPFEKSYTPTTQYYTPVNSGSNPTFTGHVGPCGHDNHNCPFKCNDWRAPKGGGTHCGYCGHDLVEHDSNNQPY